MYRPPLNLDINEIRRLKDMGCSSVQIAKIMGCSSPIVRKYAQKAGITFSALKNRSNIDQFLNLTNPVIAYFLGYLWADGFLIGRKKTDGGEGRLYHGIGMQLLRDDGEHLYSLVKGLMDIRPKYYERVYTDGSIMRPQIYMTLCDSQLSGWLIKSCGYDKKSGGSMRHMISQIPESYRPAFWLGYFDGDGTLDVGRNIIMFSSTYSQDWDELTNLFASLGVRYAIRRWTSRKGHKASCLRTCGKESTLLLMRYLNAFKGFGLTRKQDKFTQLWNKEARLQEKQAARFTKYALIKEHWHNMTESQIAQHLGMTLSQVRGCKTRIRKLNRSSSAQQSLSPAKEAP